MNLKDLRAYYRLREYQVSHLLNAQNCYKSSKYAYTEQQMFVFLFWWADAMYEADLMMYKLSQSKLIEQSRGFG